jgi:hypothetical protein
MVALSWGAAAQVVYKQKWNTQYVLVVAKKFYYSDLVLGLVNVVCWVAFIKHMVCGWSQSFMVLLEWSKSALCMAKVLILNTISILYYCIIVIVIYCRSTWIDPLSFRITIVLYKCLYIAFCYIY